MAVHALVLPLALWTVTASHPLYFDSRAYQAGRSQSSAGSVQAESATGFEQRVPKGRLDSAPLARHWAGDDSSGDSPEEAIGGSVVAAWPRYAAEQGNADGGRNNTAALLNLNPGELRDFISNSRHWLHSAFSGLATWSWQRMQATTELGRDIVSRAYGPGWTTTTDYSFSGTSEDYSARTGGDRDGSLVTSDFRDDSATGDMKLDRGWSSRTGLGGTTTGLGNAYAGDASAANTADAGLGRDNGYAGDALASDAGLGRDNGYAGDALASDTGLGRDNGYAGDVLASDTGIGRGQLYTGYALASYTIRGRGQAYAGDALAPNTGLGRAAPDHDVYGRKLDLAKVADVEEEVGRSLEILGSLFNSLPDKPIPKVFPSDEGQLDKPQHQSTTQHPSLTTLHPAPAAQIAAAFVDSASGAVEETAGDEADLALHDSIGRTLHEADVDGTDLSLHDSVGRMVHETADYGTDLALHDSVGRMVHETADYGMDLALHDSVGRTPNETADYGTDLALHESVGRTSQEVAVSGTGFTVHGVVGRALHEMAADGTKHEFHGSVGRITGHLDNVRFAMDHTDRDGGFTTVPPWIPRRLSGRLPLTRNRLLFRFVHWSQWLLPIFGVYLFVMCMYPGGHRADRFGNQFGGGPGGLGSLKVPPSWCAERAQDYAFRAWLADVVLWAGATDLEAERHGPAVAMQVHGAAREVVREIPADLLRNGRLNPQGQMETGLMLLMRTLAERYSPLEVESSTRSIAELINLRRLGGESMDSYLTRFDVLRNRAQNRGNMNMGVPGLAWMLLNGLRASPEVWDRALMPFNGNLPQDNAQLAVLTERLRRQGHLHEQQGIAQLGREAAMRQGAMGGNSSFFFPTFADNINNSTGREDTNVGGGHYPVGEAGAWNPDPNCCPACGQYFGVDDDSSETSSDDDRDVFFGDTAAGSMDPNELGNVLHNDYHMAKKRWRRFQNKAPRRKRRFGKGGYGKATSFASFLPSRAFAGGKGKSGGGGKGRRNPTDASGRVLKCHNCGSEEHLIKHCPNNRSAHLATSSTATAAHLAMGSGGGSLVAPGGHATMSSWHTRASDLEDLVQMLPKRSRQADVAGEVDDRVVRLVPGAADPKHPPPTWSPSLPSSASPPTWPSTTPTVDSSGFASMAASAPPRAVSVRSGTDQFSDAGSSISQAQNERRNATERNVLGLSQLLHGSARGPGSGFHFPWWHSDNPVSMTYHAKTRLKGGKAALLVDPGAHGNLVGSETMAQLVAQAATFGHTSRRKRLSKQMSVEGVGKQAQVAQHEEEVTIGFRDEEGKIHVGKFSAPVIEESALPPLWGRQSLAAQRAVLDLGNNRLVIPGPGGLEMRLSPGSMALPLTLSESGHLLLEVHHFKDALDKPPADGVHSFSASKTKGGLRHTGASASN